MSKTLASSQLLLKQQEDFVMRVQQLISTSFLIQLLGFLVLSAIVSAPAQANPDAETRQLQREQRTLQKQATECDGQVKALQAEVKGIDGQLAAHKEIEQWQKRVTEGELAKQKAIQAAAAAQRGNATPEQQQKAQNDMQHAIQYLQWARERLREISRQAGNLPPPNELNRNKQQVQREITEKRAECNAIRSQIGKISDRIREIQQQKAAAKKAADDARKARQNQRNAEKAAQQRKHQEARAAALQKRRERQAAAANRSCRVGHQIQHVRQGGTFLYPFGQDPRKLSTSFLPRPKLLQRLIDVSSIKGSMQIWKIEIVAKYVCRKDGFYHLTSNKAVIVEVPNGIDSKPGRDGADEIKAFAKTYNVAYTNSKKVMGSIPAKVKK